MKKNVHMHYISIKQNNNITVFWILPFQKTIMEWIQIFPCFILNTYRYSITAQHILYKATWKNTTNWSSSTRRVCLPHLTMKVCNVPGKFRRDFIPWSPIILLYYLLTIKHIFLILILSSIGIRMRNVSVTFTKKKMKTQNIQRQ